MDEQPVVLLVGHCSADARRLAAAVRAACPAARVESAGDTRALEARLGAARLVLVNRVLDGRFGRSTGPDLVALVAERGIRVMLVSNLEGAQREAERAGGAPGFGKADLGGDRVIALLREVIDGAGEPGRGA